MITKRYKLIDVDCANCAAKLEEKIKKIDGIHDVVYNFMAEKLVFHCEEEHVESIEQALIQIVEKNEPDAKLTTMAGEQLNRHSSHKGHNHHAHCDCGYDHHHSHDHHEGCGCGHDHHHEGCVCGHDHHEEHSAHEGTGKYEYILEDLDCANCAAKIESELKKMSDLTNVSLAFMSKTLRFDTHLELNVIEEKVQSVIHRYEPQVKLVRKITAVENSKENKKIDKELIQIILGSIVFMFAMLNRDKGILGFGLFMISYLILGLEILLRAFRNILKGQVFDENFLMALATVGAICIREYPEGVAVMLFYQIGEYFQRKAVEKSRKSIASLMDIRPDVAKVLRNGKAVSVSPTDVRLKEIMVLTAGERVALDGIVVKGRSSLDTSALTGESKPRDVEPGSTVLSGSINLNGYLEVEVTSLYAESTVAKILELVENASSKKAPAEAFITKFARVYTPVVVLLAALIGLVLPLMLPNANFYDYLYRALSFLVVSCPCALVISVPLSYFAGIGGLSKRGVLVKGSNYLDSLNQIDTFVFDKTGTLTEGKFSVETVLSKQPELCLELAAKVEKQSNHPVSKAIVEACTKKIEEIKFEELEEIAGRGMRAVLDGYEVLAGNYSMMNEFGVHAEECSMSGTHVYVAKDRELLGVIVAKDQIKQDSEMTIEALKKQGKKCIMLTGDNKEVAEEIAASLGVDEVYYELLPQDKVEKMDEIMSSKKKVAFVGDGINDAPVLTSADVGFAMGALGSDAAIEAADIVLMNDDLSSLLTAVKGASKTEKIVVQNIAFSLLVKIGVLLLIATGYASMWSAVFADVGVAVIAICNAVRALRIK